MVLVGLLPGFFFFLGLTLPERFTRVSVARSPLSHVAGALFVSAAVHLVLLGLGQLFNLSSPSWEMILRVLIGGDALGESSTGGDRIKELADLVERSALPTLGYVVLSSISGALGGWWLGKAIVDQKLFVWRLAQHRWLFKLRLERRSEVKQTIASALTSTKGELEGPKETVGMIVQGPLHSFGVGTDGDICYLVLQEPIERFYLKLARDTPLTTALSSAQVGTSDSHAQRGQRIDGRFFYIPGPHISNIVFEQSESIDLTETVELRRLDEAVALRHREQAELELERFRALTMMNELGECIPDDLAWRACIMRWDRQLLTIDQSTQFEYAAPELRLRLLPGEGAAGTAAAMKRVVDAVPESEHWYLTERNQRLVSEGIHPFRVIAVPFGSHPQRPDLALAVLCVDVLEPHSELQAVGIRAAVETQARKIGDAFPHLFLPVRESMGPPGL